MSLLVVDGVTKAFGGLVAVDNVSLTIDEGEFVGLIGANGAGKSTLFNLITGFQVPDRGTILFRDQSIGGKPPHKIAAAGLVKTFQLVKPFHTMTVRENVMVPLLMRGLSHKDAEDAIDPILEQVGLSGLGDSLPGALPYASRRRVEIARALAAHPRLLMLDEALAGLNQTELQEMLATVRGIHASGVTLLMIEHVMAAVMELAQRIVVLDKGRVIASGTPAEVTQDPRVIEAYLGKELEEC